jgi:hypothetical protein
VNFRAEVPAMIRIMPEIMMWTRIHVQSRRFTMAPGLAAACRQKDCQPDTWHLLGVHSRVDRDP